MIKKFENFSEKPELDYETFKELFLDLSDEFGGNFKTIEVENFILYGIKIPVNERNIKHYYLYDDTFQLDSINDNNYNISSGLKRISEDYKKMSDIVLSFEKNILPRLNEFRYNDISYKKDDSNFMIIVII
jgi:hypothetical protein